ncbi:ABC transporter permease subunit [Aminipila terrae]|uniref:ABC transporter permease subunit n=1 Tax=Aminipila terrae TaxID=2697030 RepID=A0A6P1MF82_9FIRM|nr:ABC transporter permease subunit [Aminipila terrae]QHI71803.1 ABC transporter permease subunit [Aminipila terrae]
MTIFIASLKNELMKIFTRKKFFVLLIIEIIICILCGGVNYLIGKASAGAVSTSLMLSNMPMNMLSFFIQIYIPLMIFMASCDLFASEMQDGTIRASFMRPVSRFKLFASKVTGITIMAVIYLAVLFVLTTIIRFIGGAGNASATGILESFFAYFLDIFPLIVLVLFAAMLNQFLHSPSLSIVICVIIYIGLYILGIIVPQASGLLFTGYAQWHNLWLGVTLPFVSMLSKIGLLLGYGLIFGCIGYYLFERKEV